MISPVFFVLGRLRSRPFTIPTLAVLFALAGLGSGPVSARADDPIEIPPPASTQEAAKEAFVLLASNQQRVLGLGYDGSAGDDESEFSETSGIRREEIDKAKKSSEITAKLVGLAGHGMVSGFLREMQLTQRLLVSMLDDGTGDGSGGATGGGMTASELVLRFAVAEREASALIPVSWTERSAILQKYWGMLAEDGGVEIGAVAQPDDFDEDLPPMSYEEYQQKQERYQAWLKDQERREANQRQAEEDRRRRAAERRRRQQAAGQDEGPKVGLRADAGKRQEEAPKPDPAVARAMASWHIGWTRKAEPLQKALEVFLTSDLDRRSQALLRKCQNLLQVSARVSSDPIMETPDPNLSTNLAAALHAFEAAADHCMYGRTEQAKGSIEDARRALGQTMAILRFYGLKF